jgi:hypothetical protein
MGGKFYLLRQPLFISNINKAKPYKNTTDLHFGIKTYFHDSGLY